MRGCDLVAQQHAPVSGLQGGFAAPSSVDALLRTRVLSAPNSLGLDVELEVGGRRWWIYSILRHPVQGLAEGRFGMVVFRSFTSPWNDENV
jgi:hypothetical protein